MAELPKDNIGTGEIALIMPKNPKPKGQLHKSRRTLTTSVRSYSLGIWPPGCGRYIKYAREAEAELNRLVAERNNGEVPFYHAGVIQSALKYFMWSLLLQKLVTQRLRLEHRLDQAVSQQSAAGRASAAAKGYQVSEPKEPPAPPEKPMTMMEIAGISDRITRYLEQRDNCIRRLKLDDTQVKSMWSGLNDDLKDSSGDAGGGDG